MALDRRNDCSLTHHHWRWRSASRITPATAQTVPSTRYAGVRSPWNETWNPAASRYLPIVLRMPFGVRRCAGMTSRRSPPSFGISMPSPAWTGSGFGAVSSRLCSKLLSCGTLNGSISASCGSCPPGVGSAMMGVSLRGGFSQRRALAFTGLGPPLAAYRLLGRENPVVLRLQPAVLGEQARGLREPQAVAAPAARLGLHPVVQACDALRLAVTCARFRATCSTSASVVIIAGFPCLRVLAVGLGEDPRAQLRSGHPAQRKPLGKLVGRPRIPLPQTSRAAMPRRHFRRCSPG